MEKQTEPLETLSEIRSMMERSSRFISLNGLSGVFAGIFALIGAGAAFIYLETFLYSPFYVNISITGIHSLYAPTYIFFFLDAFVVLFASLVVAISLSMRKAKTIGVKIWDNTAKRMLINLLIPLATGGLFCLILIYHGIIGLIAPATLIFYGLALINASKYTLNDIRYLGFTEIGIGLLAAIWIGYGLLFWAIGFGIMHIIYGTAMYYKYEK
jgi:hypothetical protein